MTSRRRDEILLLTFKTMRGCRVPIVVAVNGVAAGGGFSLAMAGDFVAARSARFIQVFSRIAVPDLGSTWRCRVSSAGSARSNR